jgi:hypothetical protein
MNCQTWILKESEIELCPVMASGERSCLSDKAEDCSNWYKDAFFCYTWSHVVGSHSIFGPVAALLLPVDHAACSKFTFVAVSVHDGYLRSQPVVEGMKCLV